MSNDLARALQPFLPDTRRVLAAYFDLLHLKDAGDTVRHSLTVADLSEELARRLDLPPAIVEMARQAGLLHDIGKLAVADAVLCKPGALDLAELQAMRRHPVMSERLVSSLAELEAIAPAVRAHHERWNGTGYPDGLSGEAIPLAARIVAVADTYDAMVSRRVYKAGLTPDVAAGEIVRQQGVLYDPLVVEAFRAWYAEGLSLLGVAG